MACPRRGYSPVAGGIAASGNCPTRGAAAGKILRGGRSPPSSAGIRDFQLQ